RLGFDPGDTSGRPSRCLRQKGSRSTYERVKSEDNASRIKRYFLRKGALHGKERQSGLTVAPAVGQSFATLATPKAQLSFTLGATPGQKPASRLSSTRTVRSFARARQPKHRFPRRRIAAATPKTAPAGTSSSSGSVLLRPLREVPKLP